MQAHLPQIDLDKMQAVLDIETRYVTGKITLEEGRKEVAERVGKIRPFHLAFIEQTLIEHTDEECIRENMAQKSNSLKVTWTILVPMCPKIILSLAIIKRTRR